MYIETRGSNFCCGAFEIGMFGGGEEWNDEDDEASVKELIAEIKSVLRSAKRRGLSLAFATTMCNQPNAAKALEKIGFYTSKPFKKVSDKNRKMQAWFLPLTEFKG